MSNYYKENKDEFINSTIDCNMSFQYNLFEKFLSIETKTILDILMIRYSLINPSVILLQGIILLSLGARNRPKHIIVTT